MDGKFVAANLPTKPHDAVLRLVREYRQELGGEYTVARRVSRELPPDMNELRCGITRKRKRGWMAECTCTACGDSWYTHWNCAGSISVYEGPDAQIYEWAGEDVDYTEGQVVSCASPDTVTCPNCGEQTTLVFASDLRSPRRRTRAFQTVEVMGKYGAVVAWLASRLVDRDADITEIIVPWKAVVIDEDRKLQSWSWNGRAWEPVKSLVRAEHPVEEVSVRELKKQIAEYKNQLSAKDELLATATGTNGELRQRLDDIDADYQGQLRTVDEENDRLRAELEAAKNRPVGISEEEAEKLRSDGWGKGYSDGLGEKTALEGQLEQLKNQMEEQSATMGQEHREALAVKDEEIAELKRQLSMVGKPGAPSAVPREQIISEIKSVVAELQASANRLHGHHLKLKDSDPELAASVQRMVEKLISNLYVNFGIDPI